jgi:DNA polymerase III subunit beta
MKIAATAGTLTKALALAASLDAGKHPLAALEAVTLSAGTNAVAIARNVLECQISLTIPATIERPGVLALPSGRLAALAAGFSAASELTIEAGAQAAKVHSGRSRYRLPIIPSGDLPLALAVDAGAACVELGRSQALELFAAGFAAASDARIYMGGLFAVDSADGLVGVSTNGYSLARRILPNVTGWGAGIIVPTVAIKLIHKLVIDKSIERIALRHSKRLLSVETPAAIFITRLIDGTFPDYARIIPKPSTNTVTVAREALLQALTRIHAVGGEIGRLHWADGEPALHLMGDGDDTDIIDAETTGSGRVSLAVDKLAALLDEFTGKTINLDIVDPATPVRITDRDDLNFLAVLAPTAIPSRGAS